MDFKDNSLQLFENKSIRTAWDAEAEKWYFSIVDIVAALTDSVDAKRYWSVLKVRLKNEGAEPTTICSTLKMPASDGKMRLTDVADQEQMFRLIQSIPSPKAEGKIKKKFLDSSWTPRTQRAVRPFFVQKP